MDLIRYQSECQNTKSTEFFGHRVSKLFLKTAIESAVDALTRLDAIKKSLFYGKDFNNYPVNGGFEKENFNGKTIETCTDVSINIVDESSVPFNLSASRDVLHGILGKATEASELLEALYTAAFNNQPLDRTNVIEEVGDGFWYDAIILNAITGNFHEVARINNAKLKRRFPNKFTTTDAVERNLAAEREVLESTQTAESAENGGEAIAKAIFDADERRLNDKIREENAG